MDLEQIKNQARKEAEDEWKNKLEKSISIKINKSVNETLKLLQDKLTQFDKEVNDHLEDLDKNFNEKITKILNNEISKNFLEKVDKEDKEKLLKLINSNENENDKILRKKLFDIKKFENNNPPLVILTELNNINPLINLILQCISNIQDLVMYYFNPQKEEKILKKSKDNPNNKYLNPSFLKLLDNLWKGSKKEYSPREIHDVLKELMLDNYYSKDPSFIINFILKQLHKELNFNNMINNIDNNPFDCFDIQKSYKNFFEESNNNATKISNNFFATIKTTKKCGNCSKISYYFESNLVINIYLEDNNDNIFIKKYNLIEDLNKLLIKKENENILENCIICKSQQKKNIKKEIFMGFGVIIFNINREKDQNYETSFNYPEKFKGKDIFNTSNENNNYELTIVIKKILNNNNLDEYIAYIKSFINHKWYLYSKQNIILLQNINDIYDDKNTCLLIYTLEINN